MPRDTELPGRGGRRRRYDHAGSQLQQRIETAPVQWQRFDELVIDDRSDRGGLRVDQRRAAMNGYDFRYRPKRKREVERKCVLDIERDIRLDDRLEAQLRDLNAVGARRHIGDEIDSFLVRSSRILHARRVVDDENLRFSNRCARRVSHDSADRSAWRLRERGMDE